MDPRPLRAGIAFLPQTLMAGTMLWAVPRLLDRFGTRPVLIAGAALTMVAMVWLAQAIPTGGYATAILGPLLLAGAGAACSFMPLYATILNGVPAHDAGTASGVAQTMLWIGGCAGLSGLVTVFGTAGGTLAHATSAAFAGAAICALTALTLILVAIRP